jgi:hypothetical protein
MDRIKWQIEEDGTITVTTDGVSGENHLSADQLLDEIERLSGNRRETKARKKHVHRHVHGTGGVQQRA